MESDDLVVLPSDDSHIPFDKIATPIESPDDSAATLCSLQELQRQLTAARNDVMRYIKTERQSHQSFHKGKASAFDIAIKFVEMQLNK